MSLNVDIMNTSTCLMCNLKNVSSDNRFVCNEFLLCIFPIFYRIKMTKCYLYMKKICDIYRCIEFD